MSVHANPLTSTKLTTRSAPMENLYMIEEPRLRDLLPI